MENSNINISEIEEVIMKMVKEKIEKLIDAEMDVYLMKNPGVRNGHYQRYFRATHLFPIYI